MTRTPNNYLVGSTIEVRDLLKRAPPRMTPLDQSLPPGNQSLAVSAKPLRVVVGQGKAAQLVDFATTTSRIVSLPGWAKTVALSRDGSRIAVALSGPGEVLLLEWREPSPMTLPGAAGEVPSAVAFSADGRWLASAYCGGLLRIWDTGTRQLLPDVSSRAAGMSRRCRQTASTSTVRWSMDGRRLAVAWDDGSATLHGIPEAALLATVRPGPEGTSAWVVSPRGDWQLLGDAARTDLRCLAGTRVLPFELCEPRVSWPALLDIALAGK